MKKLRAMWQSVWGDADYRVRVGRVLGLAFVTGGFVVMGVAWEGAASINFTQGQIPYLLSGGFVGLAMVVLGVALLLLASMRSERQAVSERVEEMVSLLGRNLSRLQYSTNGAGMNGQVVAGAGVYHAAGCRVLEGKEGLMNVSLEQAAAEGLAPCRVCEPPATQRDQAAESETRAQ